MEQLNGSGSRAVVCVVDCFIYCNIVVYHGVDISIFAFKGSMEEGIGPM